MVAGRASGRREEFWQYSSPDGKGGMFGGFAEIGVPTIGRMLAHSLAVLVAAHAAVEVEAKRKQEPKE